MADASLLISVDADAKKVHVLVEEIEKLKGKIAPAVTESVRLTNAFVSATAASEKLKASFMQTTIAEQRLVLQQIQNAEAAAKGAAAEEKLATAMQNTMRASAKASEAFSRKAAAMAAAASAEYKYEASIYGSLAAEQKAILASRNSEAAATRKKIALVALATAQAKEEAAIWSSLAAEQRASKAADQTAASKHKVATATRQTSIAVRESQKDWTDFFAHLLNARTGIEGVIGGFLRIGTTSYILKRSLQTVFGPFVAVAKQMFSIAFENERTRISLEALTGSLDAGSIAFERLQQITQRGGIDSGVAQQTIVKLKGFGVATSELVPLMQRFAIATRGDSEAMSRLALVYGQVTSQGRAFGDDLRQLYNAGIPISRALAEALNAPVSSLRQMAKEGKITGEVLKIALTNMTDEGTALYNAFDKLVTESGTGRWKAAFAAIGQLLGSAGAGAAASSKGIAKRIEDFSTQLYGMTELSLFKKTGQGNLTAAQRSLLSSQQGYEGILAQPGVYDTASLVEARLNLNRVTEDLELVQRAMRSRARAADLAAEEEKILASMSTGGAGAADQSIFDKIVEKMQKEIFAAHQLEDGYARMEAIGKSIQEARKAVYSTAGGVRGGEFDTSLGFFAQAAVESPRRDLTETAGVEKSGVDIGASKYEAVYSSLSRLKADPSSASNYLEVGKALEDAVAYNILSPAVAQRLLGEAAKMYAATISESGKPLMEPPEGTTKGSYTRGTRQTEAEFLNLERVINFQEAMDSLDKSLLSLSANAGLDAMYALGESMVAGADGADSFAEAIGNIGLSLLKQLPSLFLAAGLQVLMKDSSDPRGWALIGMAAGSSFTAGIASSAANIEKNALGNVYGPSGRISDSNLQKNALGNVYGPSGRINAFASGGIISSPTLFNYAGGVGLAGEAGHEALMPVTRTATGKLGVSAVGSSGPVMVTVVDQSTRVNGVTATTEETTSADGGRAIKVLLRDEVRGMIAKGELDRALQGRGVPAYSGVRKS